MIDKDKICNDEICLEVAIELGIPLKLVKSVIKAQFDFTKSTIEKGMFESIRLVYLGDISARHDKIQKINHEKGLTNNEQEIKGEKETTGDNNQEFDI